MLSLKLRIFKSKLTPSNAVISEYLSPLFKNCPNHINIKCSDDPLQKGEPLLGFCLTGGTEAPFLEAALANPSNPAIILVHDRANSYASGCELSARLHYEHKIGHRAPCIFCSINDPSSVKSVLTAAATANSFVTKNPNLGIIGDPSPWLINSGYFAKDLPKLFNIKTTKIPVDELVSLSKKLNGAENAFKQLIDKYHLDAF